MLAAWIHTETLSLEGGLGLALVGLAAFGAAWVWSLVSSLAEIRRAREV